MHSREQLFHVLAEASELEHNILCSYLYATFSLKREKSEDLTETEFEAVSRWRDDLMGVCIEEMVHLAQVSNLVVSVGARPHFNRPNLPVPKGYHPAGIEIALAPLDLETLAHFVFLERPDDASDGDVPPVHTTTESPERPPPDWFAIMPAAPDYQTIGEFYRYIRSGIEELARAMGEAVLFCGSTSLQLHGEELRSSDLIVVEDLSTALKAIDFIVEQGEGSQIHTEESHYNRFTAMKSEFEALQLARPGFCPHRAVARNPVMRPPQEHSRVHVTRIDAAHLLDAANGAYNLMLRALTHAYELRHGSSQRKAAVTAALSLMKALTVLSDALTSAPATDEEDSPHAGVSFTVLRSTEGIGAKVAMQLLRERMDAIIAQVARLPLSTNQIGSILATLGNARESLNAAQ